MGPQSQPSGDKGIRVRIRIGGRLDPGWSAWFDGLDVSPLEPAETCLTGSVVDQASLHGLLARIRDLGLPLLGLEVEETGERRNVAARDRTDGTPG